MFVYVWWCPTHIVLFCFVLFVFIPYVASFFGLSIFDGPFGILYRLFVLFLFGNRLSKRFEKDNIKVFDKNKNVDIKFIAHNTSTFVPCYLDHDRCSILSVPDEGYSRNALCALNLISTFH